jgi:tetratricopeptide (TPR) repeat protein
MLAMTLQKLLKVSLVSIGLSVALTGCSRDHIEAVNLANEGDQAVKVNVEGAIQKFEQAAQLDPTNHRILWKLASAYEKKEDWEKMASTLQRAVTVAPDFANYWYKRGNALLMQAQNGNPDAYEQAKEPLKECIKRDPNLAECYHQIGEAYEMTGDEQSAIENYSKAIEHDSTKPFFYGPLADLYLTYKLYKEAEQVAAEGLKVVPPGPKTMGGLFNLCILQAKAAQMRGDKAAQLAAVEKAEQFVGEDSHPDAAFNLGSTYAAMEPPRKEKALQLLNQFTKRTCRSGNSAKWKEQCEQTASLIQKLGQ